MLLVILLVLGVGLGVYLIGQRTNIFPHAEERDGGADGLASKADSCLSCPTAKNPDSDGDKFSDKGEKAIGTDPDKVCSDTTAQKTIDGWPPDLNKDGTVNFLDLSAFTPYLNTAKKDKNYSPRYDLNIDGKIDQTDMNVVQAYLGKQCTLYESKKDTDSDGFSDSQEKLIGTNPNKVCAKNSKDDVWPPDTNNDKWVNHLDVSLMVPSMNSKAGDANYKKRFDLNTDGKIDRADVDVLTKFFLKACTEFGTN